MRIRPTDLGWKGLLLLGALEIAFLATAYSNLFFLLLTFCGVLGCLSLWWGFANLRGVAATQVVVPAAAAEAPREVLVSLASGSRPTQALTVALRIDGKFVPVAHAHAQEQLQTLRGSLPPRRRGLALASAARVQSAWPFALFTVSRDVPIRVEVVTTPAPAGDATTTAALAEAGDVSAWLGARGNSIRELRPFRTGDSLGDVHWKATARRGTAVVKERERHADHGLVLALDRRCAPATLETLLSAVARLAKVTQERGGNLRVLSQDADHALGPHTATAQHDAFARFLAAAMPLPASASAPRAVAGALRLGAREDLP